MKSQRKYVPFLVGMLLVVGCNSGLNDQPELGQVSGTVRLDGEPQAGLLVIFGPESGRSSTGYTDEQGHFTLIYLKDTPGAKVGPHKVSISTELEDESDPDMQDFVDPIPEMYNTKTTLTAEVKPEGQVIDFVLKSKPD